MEQILVKIHSGACWDFFLRHHPIVKTNGSSCLQCHFGGGNVLCVVSTWMKQINPCYTLSPATDFALLGWLTSSFEWMPSILPNTIFSMCIMTQPTRGAKGYAIAPHPIFGKMWFQLPRQINDSTSSPLEFDCLRPSCSRRCPLPKISNTWQFHFIFAAPVAVEQVRLRS